MPALFSTCHQSKSLRMVMRTVYILTSRKAKFLSWLTWTARTGGPGAWARALVCILELKNSTIASCSMQIILWFTSSVIAPELRKLCYVIQLSEISLFVSNNEHAKKEFRLRMQNGGNKTKSAHIHWLIDLCMVNTKVQQSDEKSERILSIYTTM